MHAFNTKADYIFRMKVSVRYPYGILYFLFDGDPYNFSTMFVYLTGGSGFFCERAGFGLKSEAF